jgi:tripartite-type tricarboxylate transporter receptor subunit TctC
MTSPHHAHPTRHARRRRLTLAAATAALLIPTWSAAQTDGSFPSRPITLVIPYAAGGPADTLARALAQPMSMFLGQTVIVDAKPGGAATIGTGAVARARPDGYTLLLGTSAGHTVTPQMQKVPYDGVGDFAFIGVAAIQPNVLVVHPGIGVNSVAELVARAKQAPGQLNYASAGMGGATHLGAEAFLQRADIRITHVPYGGAAPALKDLLGGEVQMGMLNLGATQAFIAQGKLRPLAYGAAKRSALLPDVPTLAEVGMAGAELPTWYTLAAPSGTPPAVVARLQAALVHAQQDAAWQQLLARIGGESGAGTPAEASAFVAADRAAMAKLLGTLNLLDK